MLFWTWRHMSLTYSKMFQKKKKREGKRHNAKKEQNTKIGESK